MQCVWRGVRDESHRPPREELREAQAFLQPEKGNRMKREMSDCRGRRTTFVSIGWRWWWRNIARSPHPSPHLIRKPGNLQSGVAWLFRVGPYAIERKKADR